MRTGIRISQNGRFLMSIFNTENTEEIMSFTINLKAGSVLGSLAAS